MSGRGVLGHGHVGEAGVEPELGSGDPGGVGDWVAGPEGLVESVVVGGLDSAEGLLDDAGALVAKGGPSDRATGGYVLKSSVTILKNTSMSRPCRFWK